MDMMQKGKQDHDGKDDRRTHRKSRPSRLAVSPPWALMAADSLSRGEGVVSRIAHALEAGQGSQRQRSLRALVRAHDESAFLRALDYLAERRYVRVYVDPEGTADHDRYILTHEGRRALPRLKQGIPLAP
jgi:hypothetical protein